MSARVPLGASRLSTRREFGIGLGLASVLAAMGRSWATEPDTGRIVALGGTVTEILLELGLGEQVVAVDTTSVYPPSVLATRPNVGYLRQLSAEGILSVRPTLAIAEEGAGPPDVLKLVREAGVAVATVPEEPTEAGVEKRIRAVAAAVGRSADGEALAARTRDRFAALAVLRGRVSPVRTLFILSLQNGRAMVGGRNTSADGILALAGAENVAASIEGYRPMTDEAIAAAAPEAVVMMALGPGGAPPADLFDGPALSRTPAARTRRLVTMNGLYLLGFGPRTPDAGRDLLLALHPGAPRE